MRRRSLGPLVIAAALTAGCDSATGPELPADARLVAIEAGVAHACALDDAGAAYCWGSNGFGQLGADAGATSSVPVRVRDVPAFVTITAGGSHSCGLTQDGVAWCWGGNQYGQLGHSGDGDDAERVGGDFRFGDIDAGYAHTCGTALDDGTVLCWGDNAFGQLGTGNRTGESGPTVVAAALRATDVGAGHSHSCAVALSGAIYCWGDNTSGQLGVGHTLDLLTPTQVGGPSVGMISVVAGYQLSCGLSADGAALCWGLNRRGQVGVGTDDIVGVPIYVDGNLRFESIDAGPAETACASAGDATWCWGMVPGLENPVRAPLLVVPSTPLRAVTVGERFVCGLDPEGGAWCWGWGYAGQLGDGSYHESSDPVEVVTR